MNCIVADSGPLIALANADLLHLPAALYGRALLARTVLDECTGTGWRGDARHIQKALSEGLFEGLFEVVPDPVIPDALAGIELDAGEATALALAIELQAVVLIDEERGRREARQLAIPVIGVCGLLLAAKRQGFLSAVVPALRTMKSSGYFLGDTLIEQIARMANE